VKKVRSALWGLAGLVLVVALFLLVPASPFYFLKNRRPSAEFDGHPAAYWVKALSSPEAQTRARAAFSLGAMGDQAEEGVPALAALLVKDPDREVRNQAALALSKMAPASRAAVPELARALRDKEQLIRANATRALMRLGKEARPAVPALIEALADDSNCVKVVPFHDTNQELAALALGRASAGTDAGVPALTAMLKDAETDRQRRTAARALGEVGPEARPAAPLLRALLKDTSAEVRQTAEEALRKIGAPAAGGAAGSGARAPADPRLPEAERAYLWEIEHHGNVLVNSGFASLARALKEGDAAALSRLLSDDFSGADLDRPRRVRASSPAAEVERLQDAGHPSRPLDRNAFVSRLLEFRRAFGDRPPVVKLALMGVGPIRRGDLGGAWEGSAQLRLHGEHAPGAPAEVVVLFRFRVSQPTREALARPGWLRGAGVSEVLRARAPRYLFAEVARQRGLDTARLHDNWKADRFAVSTGGVYVCDFDRDGFLDVLVTDVNGCTLYCGRPGGGFEDATDRLGLPRAAPDGPVAAWMDIDGDGWDDLLLGRRVYRNEGGKRFVDYTARCNLRLPERALNVAVADFDRDGRLDLYVACSGRPGSRSWLDETSDQAGGNYLFRNKGGWQFEDVTQAAGAGGGRRSTFTAAWLDANNDGWPDLHVINEFGDGVLLVNNKDGTFREHALADRPADFGSMGLAVGDIDNDGHIDIYCANMYSKAGARIIGNLAPDAYPPVMLGKMRRFVAGSQLHLNKGGLRFEQAGQRRRVAAVGWAYGACLADLDNDGWLDLYATAGYTSRSRDEPDG
jgi:hypothetical protein